MNEPLTWLWLEVLRPSWISLLAAPFVLAGCWLLGRRRRPARVARRGSIHGARAAPDAPDDRLRVPGRARPLLRGRHRHRALGLPNPAVDGLRDALRGQCVTVRSVGAFKGAAGTADA
jgi:hypothetical protein